MTEEITPLESARMRRLVSRYANQHPISGQFKEEEFNALPKHEQEAIKEARARRERRAARGRSK